MSLDVRSRNVEFSGESLSSFSRDYLAHFVSAFESVDKDQLNLAASLISEVSSKGSSIYVAGNGGSASIADHLCCDVMKGTHVEGRPVLRALSLVSNVSVLTAISNDLSFEDAFAAQVRYLVKAGDILILISSSGNSPNILKAVRSAKDLGAKVIGFTGFDGGELRQLSDVSVHVPAKNYGVVEDCHQALMHVLAQFIYQKRREGGI